MEIEKVNDISVSMAECFNATQDNEITFISVGDSSDFDFEVEYETRDALTEEQKAFLCGSIHGLGFSVTIDPTDSDRLLRLLLVEVGAVCERNAA